MNVNVHEKEGVAINDIDPPHGHGASFDLLPCDIHITLCTLVCPRRILHAHYSLLALDSYVYKKNNITVASTTIQISNPTPAPTSPCLLQTVREVWGPQHLQLALLLALAELALGTVQPF